MTSETLRPKALDFFQDTGFLNPVSLKVTVHSAVLTLKKKKKEAKRKPIQKCLEKQCCRAPKGKDRQTLWLKSTFAALR